MVIDRQGKENIHHAISISRVQFSITPGWPISGACPIPGKLIY